MGAIRDYTGERFGSLTAAGRNPVRGVGNKVLWGFVCDCGNNRVANVSDIKRTEYPMCKPCGKIRAGLRNSTHGKSGGKSKAYSTWKRIKSRCYNKNNVDYPTYSKLGMGDEFINDAIAFMEYVGEPPKDGKKYSIDRVDNTIGYFKGNMRWATDHQQASNQGIRSDNKTGVNGVRYNNVSYITTWYDITTGKSRAKAFNVGKLGEELAFFMACEYRDLMIQRMNDLGAQYTPTHGL